MFAAASLTGAFQEMKTSLEKSNPGLSITFNFASSTQLRAQLEQGAPADVFASADEKQMNLAQEAGLLAGEPTVFAHNRLVVILPRDNPAGIETLQDLARPGVKLDLASRDGARRSLRPAVPASGLPLRRPSGPTSSSRCWPTSSPRRRT